MRIICGLFQESIDLCSNNVAEDIPVSLFKAESVGIINDSYYYLGDYNLSEKFLKQYMTFPYPHIKENAKLRTAVLLAKKGNRELALSQLHECLQRCNSNTLLHVINQLLMIYLQSEDLSLSKNFCKWKINSSACRTLHRIRNLL